MSNSKITMNFYGNVEKVCGGLSPHLVKEIKEKLKYASKCCVFDTEDLRCFYSEFYSLLTRVIEEIEDNEINIK